LDPTWGTTLKNLAFQVPRGLDRQDGGKFSGGKSGRRSWGEVVRGRWSESGPTKEITREAIGGEGEGPPHHVRKGGKNRGDEETRTGRTLPTEDLPVKGERTFREDRTLGARRSRARIDQLASGKVKDFL